MRAAAGDKALQYGITAFLYGIVTFIPANSVMRRNASSRSGRDLVEVVGVRRQLRMDLWGVAVAQLLPKKAVALHQMTSE